MFQVAFYGKGGIGKSTMAANVSYSLACKGKKVMQVGCDPKHDSTRLLLGGRAQGTVLDYVRSVPVLQRKLEDVIGTGSGGVICAEAGGPEPGIGCAGRGILTTFDTLKKLGADGLDVDIRIYDVLGDVVCGGFAVPLRGEYADAVVLVTSGEFMSMYAANNIMKGLANFDTGKPRLLGMILNSRGVEDEEGSVGRFAKATGVPIIAVMPRDYAFRDAEAAGKTARELRPDSEISRRVDAIAQAVSDAAEGKARLFYPHPLDDLQLSDLAAGREIRAPSAPASDRQPCEGCPRRRSSIRDTRIMSSCAAYGAMAAFMRLTDYTVVLHGPRSCMYLMDMSRGGISLRLHRRGMYSSPPTHRLRCTMMDDTVSIFGGVKHLDSCLRKALDEGCRKIAVVTTCMPGIIGDDSETVVKRAALDYPDAEIRFVPTDGDMAGSFTEGMTMAAVEIAGMIDLSVEPEPGYVNLVGHSFFDIQWDKGIKELDRMLSVFGLKVNCRFLDECESEDIRGFCRASIDMLVSNDDANRENYRIISARTGREPFPLPLPVGIREHVAWMRAMGEKLGMNDAAETEIASAQDEYGRFLEEHGRRFRGKKVIILSRKNDWLIDLFLDLGADIVRIGVFPGVRQYFAEIPSRHQSMVTEDYSLEKLEEDMDVLEPDLLISDLAFPVRGRCRFARIRRVGAGYRGTMMYAEYLENVMRLPATEGWKEAVL